MESVKGRKIAVSTVLASLALALSVLMLSQVAVARSEPEDTKDSVEYVNGQWVVDGTPLTLVQSEEDEIEPRGFKVKVPIGGTLRPGRGRQYGPWTSVISIQVFVSWTPTDQVIDVVCYNVDTGQGRSHRLTGGSGFVSFSTDYTKTYKIIIGNPSPPNTKTITYSGSIYLYYW